MDVDARNPARFGTENQRMNEHDEDVFGSASSTTTITSMTTCKSVRGYAGGDHLRYLRRMYALLRASVLIALLSTATSARAQAPALDEARATALRESARQHAREGQLEEAFGLVRAAAELTADATVWLEIAEAADRLRLDEVALEAYETYLARRADAPDRREIEGRARILREVLAGHRYALEPAPEAERTEALVDWNGRPVVVRRASVLLPLADWDGTLRRRPRPPTPDLLPFPVVEDGLGRRLADP